MKKQIDARRKLLFNNFADLKQKTGIEIGALCYPTLFKNESDVLYLDRISTTQLYDEFAADYPNEKIMNVDIVSHDQPLRDILKDQHFDYFIANHVIEHIPDIIGWLSDIYDLLNDDGFIFLAVPDKRFTFDQKRMETSCGHIIMDYETGGICDAAEHIIDALLYHEQQPEINLSEIKAGRYNFIHHHHVFNYETFLELIITPLLKLKYLKYSVVEYSHSTALGYEFVIILQKVNDYNDIHILNQKLQLQKQPASTKKSMIVTNESPPSSPSPSPLPEHGEYQLEQLKLINESELFDAQWYIANYSIIAKAGIDPLIHYYYSGYKMNFNPSPYFDSAWYLEQNKDVADAKYNPLWHYLAHGKQEGRKIKPIT
jgi:SAM-dependent methyltransferase